MENHIQFDHQENVLLLLDQRLLPGEETYYCCRSVDDIVYSLKEMVVRGAPAIGVTAAWGCVIAAEQLLQRPLSSSWETSLNTLLDTIAQARPTAVNLRWAVERMRSVWKNSSAGSLLTLSGIWKELAAKIQKADIHTNKRIGNFGAEIIADGDCVMTHCNAGALATAGYGTALGVIYAAWEQGKKITVIANETRPFLQGARLTAYELHKAEIPVTVACDNACALLMQRGMVHKVVVGADRIAANGDVANKIGTYGVALLAKAHGIPFYVAAPLSTIDRQTLSGAQIPIEERSASEVTQVGGHIITPQDVPVYNFAFDVTPAGLIDGIITEQGILEPPYEESIAQAFTNAGKRE